MNKKVKNTKGITLVALVITIIIMLILAGVAISSLGGENGLFANVQRAKQAQIKAEMREQLVLALQELQLEKKGDATLDDVTQEWADSILEDYEPIVSSDASISGKKVTMTKGGITGKYIIDEKLNIVETEESDNNIEFSYDVLERIDNKVKILIHVRDKENGLEKIEFPDENLIIANGTKEESAIDYEIEMGKEYKIKITSESGEEREETIIINEYYHTITKNLGEGIEIDNAAIKAAYNKGYQATLTTGEEYILETFTVTMGGQAVTVDKTTGVINIEKVTGDIVITATTKKLEIQYTAVVVTNSNDANNTTPVGANTQPKGTPLYINIIATLEGTKCTVTLKDDVTEVVPYVITRNGKYVFIVTGTYQGKTIIEEKEVTVDQYKSVVGLVKYDAGEWTQEEISQLNEKRLYALNSDKNSNGTFKLLEPNNDEALNFTFGGFTYKGDVTNKELIEEGTIITSRNQSVSPENGRGTPSYDGWQILDSYEDEQTGKTYVTKIVHAGAPENFVCHNATQDVYRASYLLSSGLKSTGWLTLSSGEKINTRDWDMYKDVNQLDLIEAVRIVSYDEQYANKELLSIGSCYWSDHPWSGNHKLGLYYFNTVGEYSICHYDKIDGSSDYHCFGVRPVILLKTGVYIADGLGIEGDPFILEKEETE